MEVEEETTSNHLEESMAPETTTVINEIMIGDTTSTDKESEKELNELISESNIREEENSSVIVPKSEDTETSVMADEKAEEVVHCQNTDFVSVSSGGIENSVVNVVEDSKDVDDDVAAVECGGVEVPRTVNVDRERNGDSEDVNGGDADAGEISAVQKDENEGDEKESLKDCEGDEVRDQFENEGDTNFQLEGDELTDEFKGDGVVNIQLEDVENVQEMVGSDVQVDEAITEDQVVAEVDKEEEWVGDKGDVKEEVFLANEETVDSISEKDEKDSMVEDEEKSLDTETETEKSKDTEMETEKSLDTKVEAEKLMDTEMESEKSLDIEIKNEKSLDTEIENEKSLDTEIENEKSLDTKVDETEKSMDTEMVTEKSLDTRVETEKSMDTELVTEKSLDTEIDNEESLDTDIENEKSLDTDIEIEKSFDTELDAEKSLDTEMENEEEANLADEERVQEGEIERGSSAKGSGGKRKRGKISKATPKSSAAPRKTIEEDVCFICFDGGDLVLCDRRNCPKAYHPSCVNRDEAFFQSKGRWDCGWHFCTICEKKAEYMCYTCTYSLCKACTKTSVLLCIREKEKKGLCEACMKIVMLIEKQGNVNLDDKNIMVPFFKDYWTETKAKHNLSLAELEHAKNPWKGSGKQESLSEKPDIRDDDGSGSDNPPENLKTRKSKRNTKKHKSNKEDDTSTGAAAGSVGPGPETAEWASKDLLEFVTHMRNGNSSVISQFEVQDLLLEYIKRNKLRDPNRKSQIICDARLENLFGKPRVAHIEMLKLLESHFLVKEDSQIDDVQGTVVDTDISPVDDKGKKRKGRKKSDIRGPQSNREDYAAIDVHNISLIYLRRKLVEDLLDDMERFHGIIVGTFVRIRISGAHQKQDIYRLVQVTGTSEAARYTLSKRTTCTMLEILNLDKTETISIDSISNQDFMEDECKRLRQSIKCGLIRRLTVGDVLDKAMELQAVRVNDWFETEIVRLNHLRDRASDLGRKKELRECVEKLNVLKTPEERARRLEEFPLIHHDPTMDPGYESEDDTDSDDKKQELYKRSDSFRFNRIGRDQFSPRGDYTSKDSWSGTPRSSSRKSHEFTESWSGTPRNSSGKNIEFTESWSGTPRSSSAKNHEFTESWSGTPQSSLSKNYGFTKNLSNKNHSIKAEDATTSSFKAHKENARDPFVQQPIILEKPSIASPSIAVDSAPKINESEKMWHYKDPSDKIQGPFSMVQLRKWSKNGYFPVGLKIWRKSDKEDDGILLTDALEGKFMVVNLRAVSQDGRSLNLDHTHGAQISSANPAPDSRHEAVSFPSPTPNKSTVGWTTGQAGPLTGPSSPSLNNTHLIACGSKDGNLAGSIGVSTLQLHDSSTNTVSVASSVAPQNVGEGVQNPVQSSQLGQLVAPPDSNMQPQMVQSVSGQNPQVWSQNLQPNPSMNMTGLQPLVYNQWTGVPNMVQNPVGNLMPAPQEPWAQQFPFPVNQPNMQQLSQPLQPNVNWGTMAANPNMGWVGPNTGNPMNWAPMVQGPQVTGTVDPTWVMQAGNVPAGWVPQPAVQGVVPNQSWVATPVQGPVVAGNGNPGWVGPVPPGNNQVAPPAGWVAPNMNQVPTNMNTGWASGPGHQGAPVPNQGWVPPTGNQGTPPPGNTDQNWGSRNRGGNWGGNDNRGNFPGERRNKRGFGFGGNRRSFNNRQESFHRESRLTDKDNGLWGQESFHRDSRSADKDDGSWRQESFHRDSRSADKDDGSWRQESFHRDSRSADKDDGSWRQESFHRDSRSTDKDDGLTHSDSGPFHGDGARSSDQ